MRMQFSSIKRIHPWQSLKTRQQIYQCQRWFASLFPGEQGKRIWGKRSDRENALADWYHRWYAPKIMTASGQSWWGLLGSPRPRSQFKKTAQSLQDGSAYPKTFPLPKPHRFKNSPCSCPATPRAQLTKFPTWYTVHRSMVHERVHGPWANAFQMRLPWGLTHCLKFRHHYNNTVRTTCLMA